MNATIHNGLEKLSYTSLVTAILASLVGIPSASASVLLPITGVTATSTSANLEGNPGFTVSNNSVVAGGSGVLGASDSLGDSGFNPITASDFGNFVTNLAGANVTYNLGAVYDVSNLLVWNFSQTGFDFVGANSVTILASTDNVAFTTVGTYTFSEVNVDPGYGSPRVVPGATGVPSGLAIVPAQDLVVSIPGVQYIRLSIQSNYFDPSNQDQINTGAGSLVGINEVNFVGTAVPEPSAWAMMLAALALLVCGAYRRRALTV